MLARKLTVVVTTSPVKSNPDTTMIMDTLNSLALLNLRECRVLVFCDGYRVRDRGPDDVVAEGAKVKKDGAKRGVIDASRVEPYEQFIVNLQRRIEEAATLANVQIVPYDVEPDKYGGGGTPIRRGFAGNVRRAVNCTTTPYVMIVQHDHRFVRAVDVPAVLRAMDDSETNNCGSINYVGFMSSSVQRQCSALTQLGTMWTDLGRRILPGSAATMPLSKESILCHYETAYGLPLLPLHFWYDRIHIARTQYYKDYVFNPAASGVFVKNFVEDTFGQFQVADVKKNGLAGFHRYNSFILHYDEADAVVHANGRRYLTADARRNVRAAATAATHKNFLPSPDAT